MQQVSQHRQLDLSHTKLRGARHAGFGGFSQSPKGFVRSLRTCLFRCLFLSLCLCCSTSNRRTLGLLEEMMFERLPSQSKVYTCTEQKKCFSLQEMAPFRGEDCFRGVPFNCCSKMAPVMQTVRSRFGCRQVLAPFNTLFPPRCGSLKPLVPFHLGLPQKEPLLRIREEQTSDRIREKIMHAQMLSGPRLQERVGSAVNKPLKLVCPPKRKLSWLSKHPSHHKLAAAEHAEKNKKQGCGKPKVRPHIPLRARKLRNEDSQKKHGLNSSSKRMASSAGRKIVFD